MRKLAKNNLLLAVISLIVSLVASAIVIKLTNHFLVYENYMLWLIIVSLFLCFFCLVKIFFYRYNLLYKYLFFIAYSVFIYVFLFCRTQNVISNGVNLELFAYNEYQLSDPFIFKQTIFNILLFLPFGCIYYKTRIWDWLAIIIFIILGIGIEYLQLKLGVGVFDITDVLLYIIGFMLGRVVRNVYLRVIRRKHK